MGGSHLASRLAGVQPTYLGPAVCQSSRSASCWTDVNLGALPLREDREERFAAMWSSL